MLCFYSPWCDWVDLMGFFLLIWCESLTSDLLLWFDIILFDSKEYRTRRGEERRGEIKDQRERERETSCWWMSLGLETMSVLVWGEREREKYREREPLNTWHITIVPLYYLNNWIKIYFILKMKRKNPNEWLMGNCLGTYTRTALMQGMIYTTENISPSVFV